MDQAWRRRRLGGRRRLPNRDGRIRVQSRTAACLHRNRLDRGQHRSRTQGVRGGARLVAFRPRAGALRLQPGCRRHAWRTHALAFSAHGGPLAVLWHGADGMAAGTHQARAATMVGSDHQQHLHVVLRAALHRRRRALAARPSRVGGLRPAVRRSVLRRAGHLCGAAGRATVGGRKLHTRRCRRRPGQPAMHVPRRRRRSRRRSAGRIAWRSARGASVCGAHLHPRLGDPAFAVGRGAAELRSGQRQSGCGHPLAARRGDRDDLHVPVATGQARVARTSGRLPAGDGVRAGVLRRTLRHRHPAGLDARGGGVRGGGSARGVVVTAPRRSVTRPDAASGRFRGRLRHRTPGRPARPRSPCGAWR